MPRILPFVLMGLLVACEQTTPDATPQAVRPPGDTAATPATAVSPCGSAEFARLAVDSVVVVETGAPAAFRPAAFSGSDTIWGIQSGTLARHVLTTRESATFPHEAWSVSAAPGVVAWRNGQGTWLMRDDSVVQLAGVEPVNGADGPPDILFSPNGSCALLSWFGEGTAHYEIIDADGRRRALELRLPGYMPPHPEIWADGSRILFRVVANGPRAGEPSYRESGWRSDLAALDVESGTLEKVTDVPDDVFLRVVGRMRDGLLVEARDSAGTHGRVYDVANWTHTELPVSLPSQGRAHAHGEFVMVYEPAGENWIARRLRPEPGATMDAPTDGDAAPVFAEDGRGVIYRARRGSQNRLLLMRASP